MPKLTNPYTAGDPIGKTSLFVGRKDVIREVEHVLRHPTQNAITLYGQRRIGKTSILQHLEVHLPEKGNYLPVYFDLMHKAGVPLEDILHELALSIALKLGLPDPKLESAIEKTFSNYLLGILQSLPNQTSLVLLLDEFDVLTDHEIEQQSKRQFFSYLRDLRQLSPQRLQFVFVLGRNMDDLDVVAQGLFKDLPAKRVSLLNQKDTETVIRLSEPNGSLNWTPTSVIRIWELTSGHPYLTQALCSQVWESAYDLSKRPVPVQSEDVENAVNGALEQSQNMFAWLWEGLGPAEKVVASALAGVGQKIVDEERLRQILTESGVGILISELRDAPQILQKWDILSPVNGGYIFRVDLLRRWIFENKPLSRTQDELDHINPVANSLFDAARGYYRGQNLDQAESLLRHALGLNPNHLRAGELLAEILLGKGKLDDAQQVLERLEEIAPEKARYRLKQVYLQRADASTKSKEKIKWYEKILSIVPNDPQARDALSKIYQNEITNSFLRVNSPRRLSPWNPLDTMRLLWWITANPDSWTAHQKTYGKEASQRVGDSLVYILVFLPMLMPELGIVLGLWGESGVQGITLLWGIRGVFAGMLFLAGVLASIVAIILASNMILVTAGVIAGVIALLGTFLIADDAFFALAIFLAVFLIVFLILFLVAQVTIGTTKKSINNDIDNSKSSYLILALLVLSWLSVAFFSFGGLTWWETGTWPLPHLVQLF